MSRQPRRAIFSPSSVAAAKYFGSTASLEPQNTVTEPITRRGLGVPFGNRPALRSPAPLSSRPEGRSAQGGDHDDEPCRNAPKREQSERDEGKREVRRGLDGARPHGVVESGEEQADDRRIDPTERRLEPGARAEGAQERQRADEIGRA